jgi:hypothetical protein
MSFPSTIALFSYKNSNNLDDFIQTVAAAQYWYMYLYRKGEYSNSFEEFLYDAVTKKRVGTIVIQWIDKDDIFLYTGPPCTLIMNGSWSQFPPSGLIKPIILSFSLGIDTLDTLTCEALRKAGPIGCRDKHTQFILELHNVQCYFSGCITSIVEPKYYMYHSIFSKSSPSESLISLVNDVDLPETPSTITNVYSGDLLNSISRAYERLYLYSHSTGQLITSNLFSFIAAKSFSLHAQLFEPDGTPLIKNKNGAWKYTHFLGLVDEAEIAIGPMRKRILDALDAAT